MTDNQSAGATPVESGATPPQSAPAAQPAADPATGDDAALGDAGKRALDAMKAERKAADDRARASDARAKALEAELEQFRTSQLSEQEKALAQARKDAAAETEQVWSARLRSAEVARQLQAAGVSVDMLDLAVMDPSFAELEVSQDGRLAGIDAAIAAFRKARPFLFTAQRAPAAGNFDGGSGGSPSLQSWTRDQIGAMDQREYERLEPEIMRAMREGRIRD